MAHLRHEEALVDLFVQWAKDGTCVLLYVELDRPSPDEPPRITVRSARPLASVTSAARMVLSLEVHRPEALSELALMLTRGADAKGEVRARLRTGGAREPLVLEKTRGRPATTAGVYSRGEFPR